MRQQKKGISYYITFITYSNSMYSRLEILTFIFVLFYRYYLLLCVGLHCVCITIEICHSCILNDGISEITMFLVILLMRFMCYFLYVRVSYV